MYTSQITRASRILISCLAGCVIFLLAASAPQSHVSASSSTTSHALRPAISTSCPAAGTGRAAVLPSLTLGTHQNIVFVSNKVNSSFLPLSGTLKRYDVTTRSKTTIVSLANQNIASAQVSADGQWILFVAQSGTSSSPLFKLQLIRMDGQFLQTLYCNTAQPGINGPQWSTNRKLIVFYILSNNTESVDLLNTTTGVVQTELSFSTSTLSAVTVRTWLDTTRIYLTNTQTDQPPNIIYILDTSKGPNQPLSNLMTVFHGNFSGFDSSYNGSQLFISSCACGQGGNLGPSSITVQPATGGQAKTLFSASSDAITGVRAVLPTTLLFTVANFSLGGGGNMIDNGLWKMNTNGTGIARLITNQAGQFSGLNNFSQFPWSNVSRNGSMYAVQIAGNPIQALQLGSLGGGAPTTFASFNGSGTSLNTVGWTTM